LKKNATSKETFRSLVAPQWAIQQFKKYAEETERPFKKIIAQFVRDYLDSATKADKNVYKLIYGTSDSEQMGVWIPNELDDAVAVYAKELDCRVNRVYGTALIKGLVKAKKIKIHI
jgi:hypothetical protein